MSAQSPENPEDSWDETTDDLGDIFNIEGVEDTLGFVPEAPALLLQALRDQDFLIIAFEDDLETFNQIVADERSSGQACLIEPDTADHDVLQGPQEPDVSLSETEQAVWERFKTDFVSSSLKKGAYPAHDMDTSNGGPVYVYDIIRYMNQAG